MLRRRWSPTRGGRASERRPPASGPGRKETGWGSTAFQGVDAGADMSGVNPSPQSDMRSHTMSTVTSRASAAAASYHGRPAYPLISQSVGWTVSRRSAWPAPARALTRLSVPPSWPCHFSPSPLVGTDSLPLTRPVYSYASSKRRPYEAPGRRGTCYEGRWPVPTGPGVRPSVRRLGSSLY